MLLTRSVEKITETISYCNFRLYQDLPSLACVMFCNWSMSWQEVGVTRLTGIRRRLSQVKLSCRNLWESFSQRSQKGQTLISEDCSQKKGIQICDWFSYRHAGKITRMPCNKGHMILHPKFYRASLRFKKAVNFKVCGKV